MAVMESVTLENFRCFREKQTVKLAPLTLLVGENSTGKTSFLALLRILSQLADGETNFDFKAAPYDLGSFDEIAHSRGGRGGRAQEFSVGTRTGLERSRHASPETGVLHIDGRFRRRGTAPTLVGRRAVGGKNWIDEQIDSQGKYRAEMGTKSGHWRLRPSASSSIPSEIGILRFYLHQLTFSEREVDEATIESVGNSSEPGEKDTRALIELGERLFFPWRIHGGWQGDIFASAPVRSKPRRTYDPARLDPDPEGDYIPMYLSDLASDRRESWRRLKAGLERFGHDAGLFDEIEIRQLGKRGSEPFKIQVRKIHRGLKGPMRNLTDVGYGVSQVLPLATELLRPDGARQFLLQQPEVHLHPSAQAALGSFFASVATAGRQLIVETHSDHLIDRIRMDARDGVAGLKPEDVLLLYFERDGLDVHIREIQFDEQGNVCGAPDTYRRFFMEETRRSLGL